MGQNMTEEQVAEGAIKGTTLGYVAGFGLSLILTLLAFYLVASKDDRPQILTHRFLMVSLVCLAVAQLFVQLLFFLHLDRESKPRWNLLVASFAGVVVLILVLGSLWIMSNLNYHMQPVPSDKSIIKDEGIHVH